MYRFYGNENIGPEIKKLYDELSRCWCRGTCASRMRESWSEENRTLGQCSITSFLVQDLLGGRVLGVPLEGGGVHCFNEIDGVFFDLTSEQFGENAKDLVYTDRFPQKREDHFKDGDKYERYLLLSRRFKELRADRD